MLSWKQYLAVATAFFAFFLVYYFPAQLAWPLLQKAGVDQVELHGLEGSWHTGRAATGRVLETPVSEISWRLRPLPWAPARGKIELVFGREGRLAAGFRAGYGGPGVGRTVLRDLRVEVPLAILADQLARFGLAVDGRLAVDLSRLELRDGVPARAEGELFLLDFQALEPIPLVLGDFTGVVASVDDGGGEGIRINLRDLGGPLAVEGSVHLDDEGYRLTAGLTPRDHDDRQLRQVIGFLGAPGRDGAIPLRFSGRW